MQNLCKIQGAISSTNCMGSRTERLAFRKFFFLNSKIISESCGKQPENNRKKYVFRALPYFKTQGKHRELCWSMQLFSSRLFDFFSLGPASQSILWYTLGWSGEVFVLLRTG